MGRTVSNAPGYAPEVEFDPRIDDFVADDRRYLHFDLPLAEEERRQFRPSRQEILQNSFWPLIGYVSEERRAKKNDTGELVFETKERPIKFGSHRDAAIYAYYARSLSIDYEKLLTSSSLQKTVPAYRSDVGNNIDHSASLIDEIRTRGNCVAIAMDISGFFDNIRHDVLYDAINDVRGVNELSAVDFLLYQRMTKFDWVESDVLRSRLADRYGKAGRICYPKDFHKFIRKPKPKAIQSNSSLSGIPQGTPLSGLYANISLFGFDAIVDRFTRGLGGSYRRYSDDLAFLLPPDTVTSEFIAEIAAELHKVGLTVSEAKTDISVFSDSSGCLKADNPFQYLGFLFDGQRVLIRQSSLNRYYAKMSRGVRAKVRAAKSNDVPASEIYMRELFRKYTHFGQYRNFPRYAYRAAAIHNAPEIRQQLRRHMSVFKKMVRSAIARAYN